MTQTFNLDRFKQAQEKVYPIALHEIQNGRKESCWMWYIFPQLSELGYSSTAKYYGLSKEEAKAYIADDLLRKRLIEISQALLNLDCSDAEKVMDYPDNFKLRSCMTLFSEIAPEIDVFKNVLEKFFDGEKDEKTIELLLTKQAFGKIPNACSSYIDSFT